MQAPPVITFQGMLKSAALTSDIVDRLDKLERLAPRLTSARVTVTFRGRRHQAGNRFRVTIRLEMPGETLIVRPHASLRPAMRAASTGAWRKQDEVDPDQRHARVAVREAFEAARRQVQDYVRRQRGDVKTHAPKPVSRLPRRTATARRTVQGGPP